MPNHSEHSALEVAKHLSMYLTLNLWSDLTHMLKIMHIFKFFGWIGAEYSAAPTIKHLFNNCHFSNTKQGKMLSNICLKWMAHWGYSMSASSTNDAHKEAMQIPSHSTASDSPSWPWTHLHLDWLRAAFSMNPEQVLISCFGSSLVIPVIGLVRWEKQ